MNRYYSAGDVVMHNWTLTRLIGEGSFGRVFEAEREDFGTIYKAAIKIIRIPQSESEIINARAEGMDEKSLTEYFRSFVEEIVREFALMSQLKGTANIVSYEDHTVVKHEGEIGWDIIIRMELLIPLLDYSASRTVTRQDVIKLGIDICKALELCQKFNILHRDIKPENIFVSNLGDYKLGDFGIARTAEKTMSGLSKKGTYTYMAPEIYRGEAYGSGVDLYSLGIVLYRLLNDNRAPFLPEYPNPIKHSDRDAALAKRISGATLPMPKNADGRLAEIVLKACEYNPKDRYSSPMQMREELEAILYSTEEGIIIYPKGDVAPQKSLEYIETGETPKAQSNEAPKNLLQNNQGATDISNVSQVESKDSDIEATEVENSNIDKVSTESTESSLGEKTVDADIDKTEFENNNNDKEGTESIMAVSFVIETASDVVVSDDPKSTSSDAASAEDEKQDAPKKKRRVFIIAACFVLLAVALAFALPQMLNNKDLEIGNLIGYQDTEEYTEHEGYEGYDQYNENENDFAIPDYIEIAESQYSTPLTELGLTDMNVAQADQTTDQTAGHTTTQTDQGVQNQQVMQQQTSTQQQSVNVPNVVGQSRSLATNTLRDTGFVVTVREEASSTVASGNVISQSPSAGSSQTSGSSVTITVSTGAQTPQPQTPQQPQTASVPNVVGQSRSSATSTLQNAGFTVNVREESSNTVTLGNVISQSPTSGNTRDRGSSVTITVSTGAPQPQTVNVPNVVGQSRASATNTLQNAGFTVSVREESSNTVTSGNVISQSPSAGSSQTSGSSVIITVSTGAPQPQTVNVPNVVGQSRASATSTLQNAGFTISVREESSNTVTSGNVISQSLAAGSSQASGSSVTITVSTGAPQPQTVNVPNVVGQSRSSATNTLQNAGFTVTVREEASATVTSGNVISQNPSSGSVQTPGSSITITVSTGAPLAQATPFSVTARTSTTSPALMQDVLITATTTIDVERVQITSNTATSSYGPFNMHRIDGSSRSWAFVANFFTSGQQTITVIAFDSLGNTERTSFTVNVQ